jgi:hypothetical protein
VGLFRCIESILVVKILTIESPHLLYGQPHAPYIIHTLANPLSQFPDCFVGRDSRNDNTTPQSKDYICDGNTAPQSKCYACNGTDTQAHIKNKILSTTKIKRFHAPRFIKKTLDVY